MAITYVTSTDQYGPAVGTDDAPGTANSVTVTWQFDNDVHLGDGWAYEPTYFNTNFRTRPYGTYEFGTPSWGARKGERALIANAVAVENNSTSAQAIILGTACMPLVIPGATAVERRMHFAYGCDQLPTGVGQGWIVQGMDSNSSIRFRIRANSAGRLEVYDGADLEIDGGAATPGFSSFPTLLATTQSPVIDPDTWYSINVKTTTNLLDATMNLEVWMGEITAGNKVIDVSGIAATDRSGGAFGALNNIDIWGFLPPSGTVYRYEFADSQERAVRDIVLHDFSGTYNTDMLGQVFVSVQETRFEQPGGGWTAHPRDNLGTGVLDCITGQGLRIADNAAFEFGSGDFTVEGNWRFDAIPETGEKVLISKWEADTNNREWKLVFDTTLDTLRWMISTDGTTETILWEYPVQDLIDFRKWYEIAVTRETVSGVSTLRVFIDGVQYGVDVTDANTYHAGPAELGIGAAYNDASTLVTASAFVGYMDEIRITKGVARYNGDYTPATAKFGREVADDADFASVSLLLGFDGSITDESSNAWTVNAETDVAFVEPDDDDYSFSVLNQVPPIDDGYIESKQARATAVLTMTGQPLDTETVTLGSVTYTFQTVLVDSANNVLIGANVDESLDNLVAAVQAGAGAGTTYGTGTTANADVIGQAVFDPQAFFQAQALGASGNSLASTETLTNGSFNTTVFEGGADIPAASDFSMERLPAEVTGVLGVQFTGRAYKSDAGAAQVRFDLVGPSAAVGTGTGLDTDLSPSWVRQVFEEDPDTSATITPSTIVGGKVRLTRTT